MYSEIFSDFMNLIRQKFCVETLRKQNNISLPETLLFFFFNSDACFERIQKLATLPSIYW